MLISHAPSDSTFESLLVGLACGFLFAVLSYMSLTSSALVHLQALAQLLFQSYIAIICIIVVCLLVCLEMGWKQARVEKKLLAAERLTANKRNISHLPAHFPNGWYKLCDSTELEIAATKHVHLLNKDVALFRAAGLKTTGEGRGEVHVLDAFCPHLGANMGHGGKVDENRLECPFHGWQFEATGECVKIPYAGKIPKNAKAGTWISKEINGAICLWYDVDFKPPQWEIPTIYNSQSSVDRPSNHGRHVLQIPGNIIELVTKHADSWTQNPTEQDNSKTSLGVYGFSILWRTNNKAPSIWKTSGVESTLSLDGDLCFFGIKLAKLQFNLRHVGPSLMYMSITSSSILGSAMGRVLLNHSFCPESPFINRVEVSAQSTPDAANPSALAFVLLSPLRHAAAKLLLAIIVKRFENDITPLYTPRRIIQLSLLNSSHTAAMDDEADRQAEKEEEEEANRIKSQNVDEPEDKLESKSTDDSSVLTNRTKQGAKSATVRPTTPITARKKGYHSESSFALKFFRSFYSNSGARKQEGLSW